MRRGNQMSRIEKTTCDACEAEIPENKVRVQVDCWPPLMRLSMNYALDTTAHDERVAEVELRELLKTRKDFCNLLCVQRWIESLGPAPLP
jgi:hypothetical protein